jgi:hypothetical protein
MRREMADRLPPFVILTRARDHHEGIDTMSAAIARLGVTCVAACFAAAGAALLFAPRELAGATGATGPDVVYQLLGAALLALGSMNYIARGSSLGGIYGRAIVTADQVHFTIGALALCKYALREPVQPLLEVLAVAYVGGAAFFNVLLFRGVRVASPQEPR